MSRGDRPYGSSPRDAAPEPAPPAAPRRRRPIRDLPGMAGRALLLAAALVMSLAALRVMFAPPAPLTIQDVEDTIAQVLASATPSPPAAVAVYESVRHSEIGRAYV